MFILCRYIILEAGKLVYFVGCACHNGITTCADQKGISDCYSDSDTV